MATTHLSLAITLFILSFPTLVDIVNDTYALTRRGNVYEVDTVSPFWKRTLTKILGRPVYDLAAVWLSPTQLTVMHHLLLGPWLGVA